MRWRSVLGLIVLAAQSVPLAADPSAKEASRFVWQDEQPRFGGFSALELGPDGKGFVAVSDRGWIIQGQLERDNDGRITAIESGEMTALSPPDGRTWKSWESDSEGLAIGPDGVAFVSFEGIHTVFRYSNLQGPAEALPKHPDFDGFIKNASLEALAIGPDGALYTMPERSGHKARAFPVYKFQDGRWEKVFTLPRRDEFLPVGADFGPDGKFYLLERRFQLIRGFANRVRRFTISDQGFQDEELVFESQAGRYYDLEGLSVWRDDGGLIRVTMISDDNFNFLQSTEIVEYVIEE